MRSIAWMTGFSTPCNKGLRSEMNDWVWVTGVAFSSIVTVDGVRTTGDGTVEGDRTEEGLLELVP